MDAVDVVFIDFEVFPYNWMIGFRFYTTKEVIQIWDDYDAVIEMFSKLKNHIIVGFNNWFYDDPLIDAVYNKADMYKHSKAIINKEIKTWRSRRFFTLDMMKTLKYDNSLKALESELGMAIEESDIDFDIDRPLTQEEIEMTNAYNAHDLLATERIFEVLWKTTLKTRLDMIEFYDLSMNDLKSPLATIVAKGLGAERGNHKTLNFNDHLIKGFPGKLKIANPDILRYYQESEFLNGSKVFNINGVDHTVGLGGIHGARNNIKVKNAFILDVVGYYSLIMMNYDLLSRNITEPGSYKYLYDTREQYKINNDPRQSSLKGGVLAVFGATQREGHLLYDPSVGDLIMTAGQAFLIDLLEKIEPYSELIQSNTDGIMFTEIEGKEEELHKAVAEWESRTGFRLKKKKIENLWQKDVNNYVCFEDGEIVAKGGFVKNYNADTPEFENELGKTFKQGAIVDKALVRYMLYGEAIEDTINNETNMMMFQFTAKPGPGYSGSIIEEYDIRDEQLSFLNEIEELLQELKPNRKKIEKLALEQNIEVNTIKVQKVNRVFASNDYEHIQTIKKVKKGSNPALIGGIPFNIFVYNGDMKDFDMHYKLDREWYIKAAKRKLDQYLGIESPKTTRPKKLKIEYVNKEFLLEDIKHSLSLNYDMKKVINNDLSYSIEDSILNIVYKDNSINILITTIIDFDKYLTFKYDRPKKETIKFNSREKLVITCYPGFECKLELYDRKEVVAEDWASNIDEAFEIAELLVED